MNQSDIKFQPRVTNLRFDVNQCLLTKTENCLIFGRFPKMLKSIMTNIFLVKHNKGGMTVGRLCSLPALKIDILRFTWL